MNWLTGGPQGEAKRLITKSLDLTKFKHVIQDLIKLSSIQDA